MTTTNPRIQVTLRRDVFDTVKRFAELQGMSMSKAIHDLLLEVQPTLQNVVAAIEHVHRVKGEPQARALAKVMSQLDTVEGAVAQALGQVEMFNRKVQAAAKPPRRQIVRSARQRAKPK